ncbi:MAG: hypothetical protein CMM50_14625 [Rhodospirillaceae bacterium]|nr:hypothetical protein [Rhodospirillaceae bacterium]|tara:strand:- start:411 stop:1193 length:783 start_codon:yes stop_codon:yes gene_type:complete
MEVRNYDAGEVIFDEGAPSDYAYIVLSGQVEILKRTEKGKTRLGQVGRGEIFGEMGLVGEKPRSAMAVARHPVTARVVDRQSFLDMLMRDPETVLPIIRVLFERLRLMNTRYAETLDSEPENSPFAAEAVVRLVPLTPEATSVLSLSGIQLEHFPFRVGRDPQESESSPLDYNDVAFPDTEPFRLSLNHFMIERNDRGITVRDRGSRFGTVVNGTRIGGLARANSMVLRQRVNEIFAGPDDTPFRFQLLIDDPSAADTRP